MPAAPQFTRADIINWLGSHEVAKGEPYVSVVRGLRWEKQRLQAMVQGTAHQPYAVDIAFVARNHGRWSISAECSCPVAYDCKHSAAVLLAALRQQLQAEQQTVNPAVLQWLTLFRATQAELKPAEAPRKSNTPTQHLFYLLSLNTHGEASLRFCKAKMPADGRLRQLGEHWSNVEGAFRNPISFIGQADMDILRLLYAQKSRQTLSSSDYPLRGRNDLTALAQLLATERLYLDDARLGLIGPLTLGETRTANLAWQRDLLGRQYPELAVEPAARTLSLSQPYYIDTDAHTVGELAIAGDWSLWSRLLTVPPLGEQDLPLVVDALRDVPDLPLPATQPMAEIAGPPIARLKLTTLPIAGLRGFRDYPFSVGRGLLDVAIPRFIYGDEYAVQAGDTTSVVRDEQGEVRVLRRDLGVEAASMKSLTKFGLKPIPANKLFGSATELAEVSGMLGLASEAAWPDFVRDALPKLKTLGWQIELPADFRHWAPEPSHWYAEFSESEQGWALALAVEVDGQRLPLAPMLAELVQRQPAWLQPGFRAAMPDDAPVTLYTADQQRLQVPTGRIKPLLASLAELFDRGEVGPLPLSEFDAPRVLEALADWPQDGLEVARQMAQRLQQAGSVLPIKPPRGLQASLRPYQLQGLAWLQYLRQHKLAGILADDMGLGKTIQTLAHVLLEKEAGRLDQPALIVLPTSLVSNWRHEAARFTPDLKVLVWHGAQRYQHGDSLSDCDLIITTYPLLWRDADIIGEQDYHLLILDEAQAVKNATSRSADAVRQLRARHKLVLTGTPMENHLGELWAQFDFLLPGFLGDERSFSRLWRTPIEKHGNSERRSLLAKRIKPFILRRKKDEVATELPAKTIMVREVELVGQQRELYETVRAAMDVKVRQVLAGKGLARSQIEILDALLKLRQVCCDPRLLPQDSGAWVPERAKLDALMSMLPELVEEGRRVLVFSQFTSMLALIETALEVAQLDYVKLTGQTRDRDTPVRRFQDGEVPIFLISLKAGGVGLNLTAADTVIHFDPWWNPAAENQATDRAHRIGQTKPVFVYKLVAAGSIEARILDLQTRKATLAAGVLSDDSQDAPKFDASDVAALLAPLNS